MPKWLASLLLCSALLFPSLVQAQAPLTLSKLEIDLWPEYDRADMLVIYHMFLDPSVSLPANVTIRIPEESGDPFNLAVRNEDGRLYNIPFTRVSKGEWGEISFSAPRPEIQLEYYDPNLNKDDAKRTYEYQWPGDYAVKSLFIQVQQPVGASGMQISPALGDPSPGEGGLMYYGAEIGSIPADTPFTLKLSYTKQNDQLSVQAGQVAPASPINASTPGRATLGSVWWWVLGAAAVLLIAVGIWWYWRAGRTREPQSGRRRHAPAPARSGEVSTPVDVVYCQQCGNRATPGDVFCRSCGTRLRREE